MGTGCRSTRAKATVVVGALSVDLDQARGRYWGRGAACNMPKVV